MEPQQPPSKPSNDQPQGSHPKPVAYDVDGNPLYAAPPNVQTEHQFVHVRRSIDPEPQTLSPEAKERHEKSCRDFPFLNLSTGEYIISAVRRHPIGLALPVGLTVFLIALVASVLINYTVIFSSLALTVTPPFGPVLLSGLLFMLLFGIGGYIAVWVYMNNKFFLTNESVIQEIQTSLFARHEQTVSLANIEDASFRQHGILQMLFNYGSIRLSTQGDETTYRFDYVTNPKKQIETLNNAVEAFKNGRPVTG